MAAIKVHYHGGFSGRAQPLDMMLEAAGAEWERAGKPDDPTVFAVPAVAVDGAIVSQLTAAAAMLGDRLSIPFNGATVPLKPPPHLQFQALKAACDIADVWAELYTARSKATAWAELEPMLQEDGRFMKWFLTLESDRAAYGAAGGFMVGSTPTYVDFLLFNVLAMADFCYGAERLAGVRAAVPELYRIRDAIGSLPKMPELLAREPVLYAGVASQAL